MANGNYTKSAITIAETSGVRLIARDELVKMFLHLENSKNCPNPKRMKENIAAKEKKISPQCGAEMMLRNSKSGVFYGCKRFPQCNHTISAK